MKYVDEYRDPDLCLRLADEIRRTVTEPRTIMEICGGQTHGLLCHGIDEQLDGAVRLIHGPGCPVCVTPIEEIDFAIDIARRPNVILTSFGDMLRVPGSRESLLQARARGSDVRLVYSPLDAVAIARDTPDRQVVFFAVGFETTTPATALAVQQAHATAVQQVDRRYQYHCNSRKLASNRAPFIAERSGWNWAPQKLPWRTMAVNVSPCRQVASVASPSGAQ